ncbi:hypothetical protein B0H16DRAFT_1794348 [Mycena metata]|uniref:3'-5' exonuclease n=1 Tax=Mycena metata TaxID=1033252 RepID=A0AAD7HG39_9AGAR|nr:hypothetical protein B0H16DRAFT_1794348 [Mycena metata]
MGLGHLELHDVVVLPKIWTLLVHPTASNKRNKTSKKNPKRRKLLANNQANPWVIAKTSRAGTSATAAAGTSAVAAPETDEDFDLWGNEQWGPGDLEEMSRIEKEALHNIDSNVQPASRVPVTENHNQGPTIEDLHRASKSSRSRPFFSNHEGFAYDSDNEDGGLNSQNEEDEDNEREGEKSTSSKTGWFTRPKRMPEWEYEYIIKTVQPIIRKKDGRALAKPSMFDGSPLAPPTFWIRPPEPVFSLAEHRFDPTTLYRRRIFLWLPHFLVEVLRCPDCGKALEKNGPLVPRLITDIEDSFYIISWAYYCRSGCRHHFHGWTTKLRNSLPPYLQLAFPAILSRKGGLSRQVLTLLRGGNQHKMGPTGVRSLLFEMHTLRFNTLQLQYLESMFELEYGAAHNPNQPNLHAFAAGAAARFPTFGDFGSPQGYNGFVPSVPYLSSMMNKAIEREEDDADQHTACQEPDNLAIDDSHKINKHMAKINGVPVFGALWTCMTSRYIRAQVLTLTKGHDERLGPLMGIASSARLYGFDDPAIVYSDDPVKDKAMLYAAFPSLTEKLTPIAAAHGLTSLSLPSSLSVDVLESASLVESAISSLMSPLDIDPTAHLCVSLDAEWNISRHVGVSVLQLAPHSDPDTIYIIPVHRFKQLPAALLHLLVSPQTFLIGSAIKADLTRLKKQFPQLLDQSFNIIDLKEFAVRRGIIKKNSSGSLDTLAEKALGSYLPKDPSFRRSENWELNLKQHPDLLNYAALDVFASRLIFDKINEMAPLDLVRHDTPAGTRIALLVHEGGEIAAYGRISPTQPASFSGVKVTRTRLLVDIDVLVLPSAAAILHLASTSGRTKSGALTLAELQSQTDGPVFRLVTPIALLEFDRRSDDMLAAVPGSSSHRLPASSGFHPTPSPELDFINHDYDSDESDSEDEFDLESNLERESERTRLQMLEAHNQVNIDPKGKTPAEPNRPHEDDFDASPLGAGLLEILRKLAETPQDIDSLYTRIKKDLFHAFHMIPIPAHGLRAIFFRTLRDHIMRWDPKLREIVDETCRRVFNVTFEVMLIRDPRWVQERVPRYVPPPSILVPAIQHVYNAFADAIDAQSGRPLFNKKTWEKTTAVLELAREGYLSDIDGVVIYEKAAVDEYGLQKFKNLRGTSKVEGGPHGDIYRKFGALNAGPRLTVNSLIDHRTRYNLQAFVKHHFGLDWDYHYTLGLLNRTSFLLNYLSDVVEGAHSYSGWVNTDLYERTTEKFGICRIPESLHIRTNMAIYSPETALRFKLNPSDDWLRRRQGVALPILPPTTLDARKYFFAETRKFAALASAAGRKKIDFEAFAREWNGSADGKTRYYVTADVLSSYSKTWEKISNIRASQDLITAKVDLVRQTGELFSASTLPFPDSLKGNPTVAYPRRGVADVSNGRDIPQSISVGLAMSHPRIDAALRPSVAPPTLATSLRTISEEPQDQNNSVVHTPEAGPSTDHRTFDVDLPLNARSIPEVS